MQRGGFDAIVGNPPFMGGQKITGNLGDQYREYLVKWLANGKRGSADLCAYFFLRARFLLHERGQLGSWPLTPSPRATREKLASIKSLPKDALSPVLFQVGLGQAGRVLRSPMFGYVVAIGWVNTRLMTHPCPALRRS